jgi:segregation and condensation protein A
MPDGWDADPAKWRSATASTFAASLELAKEGKVELRQSDTFAPIELRRKDVR